VDTVPSTIGSSWVLLVRLSVIVREFLVDIEFGTD
jgi:hypothetical protein